MALADVQAPSRYWENIVGETDVDVTEITGTIPDGLLGTLYRNGSGRWNLGSTQVESIFDADGMVSAFVLDGSGVRFRNRFVRTKHYLRSTAAGRLVDRGFAYQREQSSGVYLKVMARGTVDKPKTPLNWRHHIRNVQGLEDYLRNHTHIIKDHSWVTHHYNDAWQDHGGPVLENLGRFVRTHTAHDRTYDTHTARTHASRSNRAPLFCGKQVGLRYESDARRCAQLHGCAIQRLLDPQRRYARSSSSFLTAHAFNSVPTAGSEYNGLDMSLSEQLYTPDGSSRAWVGTRYKEFIGTHDTHTRTHNAHLSLPDVYVRRPAQHRGAVHVALLRPDRRAGGRQRRNRRRRNGRQCGWRRQR